MPDKARSKENKVMIAALSVIGAIIFLYFISGVYFANTGKIKTEIIKRHTHTIAVEAKGIVLRDESRMKSGVNQSILKSNSDGVFVPSVEDGSSVAKGDYIAYEFPSEKEAQAYAGIEEISREIEYLNTFKNIKNPNLLDVSALNSAISHSVDEYISAAENGDLTDIDALADNINYAVISRQFATGETVDFSGEISKYAAQIRKLEKTAKDRRIISAPFAGYFTDYTDGFEDSSEYYSIKNNSLLSVKQIEKLLKTEPKPVKGAFGKLIGEHIWYLAANIPVPDASSFVTGKTCTVSFPQKGVKDIEMTVIGAKKGKDMLSVHFKSKKITPEILHLRIEDAVINTQSFSGLKISSEALASDEKGNLGVYVYAGNLAVFKPIQVIYRAEDFVLAEALENYPNEASVPESDLPDENDKLNDKDKKDITLVPSARQLKEYDRIIVKGRNIYDRKVIR